MANDVSREHSYLYALSLCARKHSLAKVAIHRSGSVGASLIAEQLLAIDQADDLG